MKKQKSHNLGDCGLWNAAQAGIDRVRSLADEAVRSFCVVVLFFPVIVLILELKNPTACGVCLRKNISC